MEITLNVEGMMCEKCEARVENALKDLEYVKDAKASHTEKNVIVTVDEENYDVDEMIETIEDLGYEAEE
ncbi:MAG: heavy-metal-associated domain-containing protein [Clostridia bacterium]|nr:heavy-metal-associated domain-containing protein [Bacilli bacterium]MBR3511547.1 heavy-metal-associated domain-containing protein [Clostridia bacterium]